MSAFNQPDLDNNYISILNSDKKVDLGRARLF